LLTLRMLDVGICGPTVANVCPASRKWWLRNFMWYLLDKLCFHPL